VQQAQASIQNIEAQMAVQQAQISASQAQLDQAQAGLVFAQQQASRFPDSVERWLGHCPECPAVHLPAASARSHGADCTTKLNVAQRQVESLKAQRTSAEASLAQAKAQLRQAQVNLERTRHYFPVDGYVTNLLAQLVISCNVGVTTISLVDAHSYWVDGYFEETNVAPIRVGDPAQIKLMGTQSDRARSRRQHRARHQRFERAAQRSGGSHSQSDLHLGAPGPTHPGPHHIDEVPAGVVLSAGMTATVEIDDRARATGK